MEKKLKKSYECLDLPFSATVDEVVARKNALIKVLSAKEIKNKISTEKEIATVESSANAICENINKNGIPKNVCRFESSNESIVSLFVTLMFVVFVCYMSFYIFL